MRKFAVITNYNIKEKAKAAISVIDRLHSLGASVCTATFNRERINRNSDGKRRDFIEYISLDKLYQSADVILLLGGDGTILEAARRAVPAKKPMLGVNLGRLGYMAELELNEIDRLADVVDGRYRLDERMVLKIEILDTVGKVRFVSFALNDAVVSNGSVARIVDLRLSEGGSVIADYRADGVIAATPTGSTAYSMSAGGAIVDPSLRCICVTPVCPHSLISRPMIFPADAAIEIKNTCNREKVLFLTLDGKSNQELALGETVRVTESEMMAKLIRLNNRGFYDRLRIKMNSGF